MMWQKERQGWELVTAAATSKWSTLYYNSNGGSVGLEYFVLGTGTKKKLRPSVHPSVCPSVVPILFVPSAYLNCLITKFINSLCCSRNLLKECKPLSWCWVSRCYLFHSNNCLSFHVPVQTDTNTQRETGRTAQINNIIAAKVYLPIWTDHLHTLSGGVIYYTAVCACLMLMHVYIHLDCFGHYPHDPGSSQHVEDVAGPHGRYRHDQRRQLDIAVCPTCCPVYFLFSIPHNLFLSATFLAVSEVEVSHPAAKSMIELSRAQDEEVGDGTTSVIILSKRVFLCCMYRYIVIVSCI